VSDRYAAQLGTYRRSVPIWSAGQQTEDATASTCRIDEGAPMACERCGNPMYRMHAVWRCPKCRFKTDCCGW
jgi:rubrerythrin